MTIEKLKTLLKQSGVNSKKQVIDLLETKNINELCELRRSIDQRIALIRCSEKNDKIQITTAVRK